MKYEIVGENMQHLHITLEAGETVYADSGTFVSKTKTITMTPKLAGGIVSAVERRATGATALLTEFEAKGDEGKVAVAGVFPGKVLQITLQDGQRFTVEKKSFLAAESTVKYSLQVMSLEVMMLGKTGPALLELVGPGNIFIHVVGDIIQHDITPDNTIEVNLGHFAGFDSQLKYSIKFVDNVQTAMFGGIGLFLATFEGEGRVISHSVSREKLALAIFDEIQKDKPKEKPK